MFIINGMDVAYNVHIEDRSWIKSWKKGKWVL